MAQAVASSRRASISSARIGHVPGRCSIRSGVDESRGLDAGSRRVRVGEETDLMRRLQAAGACAVYLPDALLDHHVPEEKTTLTHVAQRAQAAAYTTGTWMRRRKRRARRCWGIHAGAFADSSKP